MDKQKCANRLRASDDPMRTVSRHLDKKPGRFVPQPQSHGSQNLFDGRTKMVVACENHRASLPRTRGTAFPLCF